MNNANIIPSYLPRDQVFRYTDRRPAATLAELERKAQERIDHLQEQINKMSVQVESKLELDRKSDTRHNLLTNSGFRIVSSGVPTGWTSAGAGVTFSQQTVRPGGNTSNYSARIVAPAGNEGSLSITVPVFPGQRFSIALWAKVTSGTGYVTVTPNGTSPKIGRINLSSADGVGFIAIPSLKKDACMVELPTDCTTVTIKFAADASSTVDFCEPQYGHGTQRVPHLWVDNSADYVPNGGNSPQLLSGTYTPTAAGVLNIDAVTPGAFFYTRIGDVVACYGTVTVDPTAAGATTYSLTLPIASNLSNAGQLVGSTVHGPVAGLCGEVIGRTATDDALVGFVGPDGTSRKYQVTFGYRVI